jgi:glucosamine-6-phosphate deaminase
MVVQIFENEKLVSRACATLIAAQVIEKPDSVLGLATGSSPLGTYKNLVKMYEKGVVDFSSVISFNLDEYIGIPEDNPCSYHQFMEDNLFQYINIFESYIPNGNADDLEEEGLNYDSLIEEAGGIDLQLLGIGHNGHIGFNEPDEKFSGGTQVVNLAPSTIQANRRFFESEEDVPSMAISMGIGTIMAAKKIVLIAMGKDKAEAIKGLVEGEISPWMPASILRLHKNVTILCDEDAASLLSEE